LFTPEEAAERLKITLRQLRRAIYEGKINRAGVTGVGRGGRIWGWALNEFVQARTIGQ
jgi:excisionase family DNA binding protein